MATDAHDPRGASPDSAAPRSASAGAAGGLLADGAVKDGRRRVRAGVLVALVLIAAAVVAADQAAKAWAIATLPYDAPTPILGDLLVFRRVANPGAAFSLASGSTWIFSIIAVGVVVFLIGFAPRIRRFVWGTLFGLLLGGTIGNLIDRLTRPPGFGVGHVIDFVQIPLLPAIFNLADVAIVSSMCLFVLLTILGVGVDGSARPAKRARRAWPARKRA